METRANYALIGLFTLAVIAGAFGFVYWFAGRQAAGSRASYRIVFSGNVSGLQRGGSVLFNGIRVGEVTGISLLPEDPRRVIATVEVDPSTPVRADTRARLEANLLSGVAAIQLSGGEPGAQPLVAAPGETSPTIFADRSDFQDIVETVRKLAGRVDDVITRADKVISDNEASIGRTVRNVETFTQALAGNSDNIGKFLTSTGAAADRIAALSGEIDAVIRAIDPQRIGRIVANIEGVSEAVSANRAEIDSTFKDIAGLTKRLNDTAPKLDQALTEIANLTRAVDSAKIGRTVDNIDRFSQALGRSAPSFDRTVQEAEQISVKLNKSADRLDGVLASIQGFFGDERNGQQARGLMSDIGEAAKSIRTLANNLDTRTAQISVGLTRFSAQGLREYEALAVDGRRTLVDLNRVLRSFEKNPSQLIFGTKAPIPEYSGSR